VTRVITGREALRAEVGHELGVSSWLTVDQPTIDAFATATGDHQWIHTDVARSADGPHGGTIAHGLLTLALGPRFLYEIFEIAGVGMGLNYGYDRIRFPAPLPVGARLRMRAVLQRLEDVPGGVQLTIRQTFEVEGAGKPVCVADSVSRWLDPAG
jgi:acyl dehydratase